jgi:hypothetical protein
VFVPEIVAVPDPFLTNEPPVPEMIPAIAVEFPVPNVRELLPRSTVVPDTVTKSPTVRPLPAPLIENVDVPFTVTLPVDANAPDPESESVP